nr:B-box zinc finger protein 22 [Ipomoea batatas]
MKIQCNVCEVAEANVLCCADEAALCWSCDEKVHAANKLASKHQRVPLSGSSSSMPKCDICQETVGYFFCLEDRALLCRKCDVAIHTANAYVSAHQRFLLTGVKVGLEPTEPGPSSSLGKSQSGEKISELEFLSVSRRNPHVASDIQYNKVLPTQITEVGNFAPAKAPFAGGSAAGSIPQWQLDEFLGLNEFNQNYGYMDNNSSKADSGKLGDTDCSATLRVNEEELDGDECLGPVLDASWAVPQIPSPPTASGLYWPKTNQNSFDSAVFVPDICYSPMQNFDNPQPNCSRMKRRRQY